MNSKYHRFVNYYHANKDNLFTYLMYRLGFDRALAENLMMEIFLKAYEHLDQLDSQKDSFKTWLFALAHNHLANHSHKEGKAISRKKFEESGFDEIGKEDYEMSQQIDNKKVQYIFTLLKEGERDIISLRYLQGFSLKEISRVTEKKEAIIRTNSSQALNRLAALYKKVYLKK